jgi:hypothetical protein
LKNPSQKIAGLLAQGVGPEFKPQYQKTRQEVANHVSKVNFDLQTN